MKYIVLLSFICLVTSCTRYSGFTLLRSGNAIEIAELTVMLESYGYKYKISRDDSSIYVDDKHYEFVENELNETLYDETRIRKIPWPRDWIREYKTNNPNDTIAVSINGYVITVEIQGALLIGNENRISGIKYHLNTMYKDYQIQLRINGRS